MVMRRSLICLWSLLAAHLAGCGSGSEAQRQPRTQPSPQTKAADMSEKITKTDAQWQAQLTPEQYRVARQCGTEPPFTGKYWNTKTKGVYQCVCCGQELFHSGRKYKSGSGWPSFWAPIDEKRIARRQDDSLGVSRVEIRCGRCGAHLGHVFEDGPQPTGLRYCLNSASLKLVEEK